MADLPRMDERQLREARRLIRKRCCNYDNGSCIALDDGIYPVCPQWDACSLICKWFRDAVLPSSPDLQDRILASSGAYRKCAVCGRYFLPTGSRSKYCRKCAAIRKRENMRKRVRRYRGQM